MGRQIAIHAGLARIALDNVPERLARHAIATAGGKQIVGAAIEQNIVARTTDEGLHPAHRLLTQRNQAFAIAPAQHAHHALIQVDLAKSEADQPETRRPVA